MQGAGPPHKVSNTRSLSEILWIDPAAQADYMYTSKCDATYIVNFEEYECNQPRVLLLAMCPCKFLNQLIGDR